MTNCQKVIKLEFLPGTCAICNSDDDNDLKSIEHNHVFNDSVENYRDMLMKCFGIKLIKSEDQSIDVEICGSCVGSLRSAASFRQLVEAAEKTEYKNIPPLKNESANKSPRKGVLCAKNLPCLKAKRKSYGTKENTKQNKKVPQLTEIIADNNDFNRPGDFCQVKVEWDFNHEEIDDNFSNVSDQVREDSNSAVTYDIFDSGEQVTDGESSTTSTQMRVATGYEREIEISKKKEVVIVPPLDISCNMCPICDKKFVIRHLLSTHYDNHFPTCLCDICGLSYSKKRSYYHHRLRHLLDNKHPCTLCSKSFSSSSAMAAHVKTHHNKVKPVGCTECDARFPNNLCRRRHMHLKHGKECIMYPCTICEKSFYSPSKLNTHIKKSHDNIKSCLCTVCEKGFYGKEELREHMVMHTDANKHKCDKCGKGYPRIRSLREHLKIHDNIRDYACEVCDKTFVQKSTLKTHMKTHTKISN